MFDGLLMANINCGSVSVAISELCHSERSVSEVEESQVN